MASKTTPDLPEETLEWFGNWEKNPRFEVLSSTVRALTTAAIALTLNVGKPQEAQAQEVYTTETAVFRVDYSASDTLTDEDIAKIEEGVARFNEELALLPDDTQIAHQLIGTLIDGFDTFQKQRLIGLFNAGMTVQEAVEQVYFSSLPRTPDTVRVMHAQAISIGLREFILNMKVDPELEWLEEQDYVDYANELMNGFLDGTDNSRLEDFYKYAPFFTWYVEQNLKDFVFAQDIVNVRLKFESEARTAESEARTAESEARTAESEARTAESEARTAELREINEALELLIRTLQANS